MRRVWLVACATCFALAVLAAGLHPAGAQPAPRSPVTGYVVDASDGRPLPGASVFVDGTTRGAATDARGFFEVGGVPEGWHDLVVSMVGYRRAVLPLRVTGPPIPALSVRLSPAVVEAEEVVISAERPAG